MTPGSKTLLDAFTAGSQFTRQAFQPFTEELKRKNDFQLELTAKEYETGMANWMRDNPFNYTGDPDDAAELEQHRKNYNQRMNEYTDSLLAKAGKNNRSRYFNEQLGNMRHIMRNTNERNALVSEDKFRISYETDKCAQDILKTIDSMETVGYTPEEAVRNINTRLDYSATIRDIQPDDMNKMRRNAAQAVYQRRAGDLVKTVAADNPGDLTKNMDAVIAKLNGEFAFMGEEEIEERDRDGNVTGVKTRAWTFEGKDEFTEKLIHGRYYEIMSDKQAWMNRLRISGRVGEAIEFAKQWGAELNKCWNPKKREFAFSSNDIRPKMDHFFDWQTMAGYARQGGAGGDRIKFKYTIEQFLESQLKGGNGTVLIGYYEDGTPITCHYSSINDAFDSTDGFLYWEKQAFLQGKGDPNDAGFLAEWEGKRAEYLQDYFTVAEKMLKNLDPALGNEFDKFRSMETYLNPKSEFFVGHVPEILREQYAEKCIDLFNSLFFNGITDIKTIKEKMRYFTGEQIGNLLKEVNIPASLSEAERNKQLKIYSDRIMSEQAEDLIFIQEAPQRLQIGLGPDGRKPEPTYITRSENQMKALETLREEERGNMADMLGISRDRLVPDWMPSPGERRRHGDVIGKGVFHVKDGPHAGTYYMDYDDNHDRIIRRLDDKSEYMKKERPLTTAERRRREESDYEFILGLMRGTGNSITGEYTDPITGETKQTVVIAGGDSMNTLRVITARIQDPPPAPQAARRQYEGWERWSPEKRLQAWQDYHKATGRGWEW